MLRPLVEALELRRRILEILPEIIEARHALHRTPELMLEEHKTAQRIRSMLQSAAAASPGTVELLPPYLGTDTVGLVHGRGPGVNVTIRADIDALPVADRSGRPWASRHEGCSHACGHDGHTAILLGTILVLASLSDRFAGSVRFVFQPAEEQAGGGKLLVEKGLLDAEPRPEAVFALHGWPGLPVGTVAAVPGVAMAAQDRFRITVTGRGGHGAQPQKVVDPILTGAHVVTALQSVVSRSMDPVEPAVLSVCTFHGGTTSNVIPHEAIMEGTVRYFDRRLQALIRRRIQEIAAGICAAAGAAHAVEYREGYIPLVNDPEKVKLAQRVTEAYLGREAWFGDLPRTMGAEDFAFYLDRVPGVFLRLGLGEDSPGLHNQEFDFNDDALPAGITIMSALALESLSKGVHSAGP